MHIPPNRSTSMSHFDSARPNVSGQRHGRGQKSYRADIEGLRAVAVLAVVLFHAEVPGIGGGYVGVDVFFVISGFLITGLLCREVRSTGSVRLRNFYGARARRLLPASATVGIITMIASVFLLPPLMVRTVIGDCIASALYVSNYRFAAEGVDYFGSHLPPSPFLHYWSLGVEEQFYIVWAPLILGTAWLIRIVRKRGNTGAADPPSRRPYVLLLAAITVASFALSYAVTQIAPASAFYPLATRAWQLALGGLVALTALQWQRLSPRLAAITGWVGLILIVLACFWLTAETAYPGTAALLPTAGSALVIGAGCTVPERGCGRLLGRPPMRAIGRISYSWYLWHWPVLVLAPAVLGHPLGLGARLTAALLSAGLAWLTLRYLEDPLRFTPKIRHSAWRSLGLGALSTAIAVCVGLALLKVVPNPVGRGAPASPVAVTVAPIPVGSPMVAYDAAVQQAFAQVQSAVATSATLQAVPANLVPPLSDAADEADAITLDGCLLDFLGVEQPACVMGDTESPTTVALVGDSHAAIWNPALRQVADSRRWRVETMAKEGCPLLDLPLTNPLLHREYTECEQWRTQILDRLRAGHPRLIVFSLWRVYGSPDWPAGFKAYGAPWLASLTRMVRQLRDTGAQVLVLGPLPAPKSTVPVCISSHLDDAVACAPARSTAVNGAGIAAEAAATTAGGGQYADLTDLFCTAQRCPVIIGNTLVYLDWNHMSVEYSRALAPVIGALADRTLALSG